MRSLDTLHDKQYLGDGVYAGYDGYHIVLWLEDEGAFGPNAIALEPGLRRVLRRYINRVSERSDVYDKTP